jgi:hypothetical protein
MDSVRPKNRGRRRRCVAAFASLAVLVLLQVPANAGLQIPELPELPLPTATPLIDGLLNDLPVSGSTEPLTNLVNNTTGSVGGLLGGTGTGPSAPKGSAGHGPRIGSPATIAPVVDAVPGSAEVRVSGNRIPAPSYGAAVSDGFSRTARRAAELAGPVAVPMVLAVFAVMLLFLAARGPGRLVKVEEERKAFHEQRSFRL